MLTNYLLVAVRNLMRNKAYSFINVVGLAAGIACCILILLFIQDELSYDRFHTKADRIYLILRETRNEGQRQIVPRTSGKLHDVLANEFPEVELASRVIIDGVAVQYKNRGFRKQFVLVDPASFEIFSFPFLRGNAHSILQDPKSTAITEKMAEQYFGEEDPMGKVLTFHHRSYGGSFIVRGILKDLPPTTTIRFDMLATTLTPGMNRDYWDVWRATGGWGPVYNYLLLKQDANVSQFEAKLQNVIRQYMGEETAEINTYYAQPIVRSHLYSKADYNMNWRTFRGDIQHVYLLGIISVFILLIACINFMNLATARSARRAREVGLRKVVGANRPQLIAQFLGEAVVMTSLSMIIALGLVKLALPEFTFLSGKSHLSLDILANPQILGMIILTVLAVGLLAGSYPAFFISAFEPAETLHGSFKTGTRGSWIRKQLVVMQFTLSILLIIGTTIVYQQMDYIKNHTNNVEEPIVFSNIFHIDKNVEKDRAKRLVNRYQLVKDLVQKHPNVRDVSAFSRPPGRKMQGTLTVAYAEGKEEMLQMLVLSVDEDYIPLFGIEIVAGRNFRQDIETDRTQAYILNETAVKRLGWDEPLGKAFGLNAERDGKVIGVAKDFHFDSLHNKIDPLAFRMNTPSYDYLGMLVKPENLDETISFIEETWKRFIPDYEFPRHQLIDDWFDIQYRTEKQVGRMATIFSGLAILLACLGLLGLVSYAVEQRTKEIGVRKVLGSSVGGIMILLSKDFIRWVLIANVLAWPLAYFAAEQWLQSFAYRIDLGLFPFVLAASLAAAIAIGAVSIQAWNAAQADPVEALKYE